MMLVVQHLGNSYLELDLGKRERERDSIKNTTSNQGENHSILSTSCPLRSLAKQLSNLTE